jgi:hypothetical protein
MPDPRSPAEGRVVNRSEGEAPEHILQFFAYAHLPPQFQIVSRPFAELADVLVEALPRNPERTVALRKLLEAKDAAVRARLAKDPPPEGRIISGG